MLFRSARSEASCTAKQFNAEAAFQRDLDRIVRCSIISWHLRHIVCRRALRKVPFGSSASLFSLALMFRLRVVLVAPWHATHMFTRAFLVLALAQIEVETDCFSRRRLVMHPMKLLWHRLPLVFASPFALGARGTSSLVERFLDWGSLCTGRIRSLIIITLASQGHRQHMICHSDIIVQLVKC